MFKHKTKNENNVALWIENQILSQLFLALVVQAAPSG
jgi:hypothetical protein